MSDEIATSNKEDKSGFSLGKVYLKDVSLEVPYSPTVFQNGNSREPKVTLQYKLDFTDLLNDMHEVALTLTITAAEEERTIFLVEIQQGGIFLIRNTNKSQLGRVLNVHCPRILFPYAREAIDNLLVKAGFQPLMLAPLNFLDAYNKQVPAHSDT